MPRTSEAVQRTPAVRQAASPLVRVPRHVLEQALFRTPLDLYVIWTGHVPPCRPGSLRSRVLSCVHEVGQPVSLRVLLQRTAGLEGDMELSPRAVRDAIKLHQQAKPAAYLLVRRIPSGELVAVNDIPFPAGTGRPIRRGGTVMAVRDDSAMQPLRTFAKWTP